MAKSEPANRDNTPCKPPPCGNTDPRAGWDRHRVTESLLEGALTLSMLTVTSVGRKSAVVRTAVPPTLRPPTCDLSLRPPGLKPG